MWYSWKWIIMITWTRKCFCFQYDDIYHAEMLAARRCTSGDIRRFSRPGVRRYSCGDSRKDSFLHRDGSLHKVSKWYICNKYITFLQNVFLVSRYCWCKIFSKKAQVKPVHPYRLFNAKWTHGFYTMSNNVKATSWRCIDVNATSYNRHMLAGCPAGTWRLYNVLTSNQRHDVEATLYRRHVSVVSFLTAFAAQLK